MGKRSANRYNKNKNGHKKAHTEWSVASIP